MCGTPRAGENAPGSVACKSQPLSLGRLRLAKGNEPLEALESNASRQVAREVREAAPDAELLVRRAATLVKPTVGKLDQLVWLFGLW